MRDALTDETFHYMLGVQFQVPRNMVEYFQSRQNTDATFVIRKQKPGFFGVLRNLFREVNWPEVVVKDPALAYPVLVVQYRVIRGAPRV